ncbi:Ankyrin repeat domain-containing protein 6 [Eumeta japonica]|uniref:Ankyrin repeat domain-containing protein 6 n=1 Tax=Eumeta variegata TaxID=151549 RepID=A0A4C1TVL1_EUMVA|nr:Ankyrin repeat domain-containing protein 6 [Eumeta japonica]
MERKRDDGGGNGPPELSLTERNATAEAVTSHPISSGCSCLQRAAADGHGDTVQLLLRHGADPNHQDVFTQPLDPPLIYHLILLQHGNTAAHEAAWKGYSRCVALLAAAGADLTLVNYAGFAPLHLACQSGHNQSCRELLLAGAPPDLRNNYGDTSLHTAARYGHAGVTRILISAQSRVFEQNKNGDTALHIAAAMGRRKLTRILLEAGCDKSLRNQQGETARDIATRKGLDEIISILNTPVAKQPKKKDKRRSKSKERTIDEPAEAKRSKDKKKKNVHFEVPPVHLSPYGCHYYPDTKYFPKPRLSSLPTEPLKKGEQYYLDLAGNIKKGPIGTGYTCYCAPFFKHMEDKMNEDKKDLKRHIDRAHERLDQKVTDLEMRTKGQISELTRFVAAERALCKERHKHLEDWLTRGMIFRASERPKKLEFSPRGSLDIPPLKRTRSLELLDIKAEEWNKVNNIIKSFNQNAEKYENNAKDLNDARSKSTEILDTVKQPEISKQSYPLKCSKSSDFLDTSLRRSLRSPQRNAPYHNSPPPFVESPHMQNVTAEIHVKSNRISISQSPLHVETKEQQQTFSSPSRQSRSKSPSNSNKLRSEYRASDSDGDERLRNTPGTSPQNLSPWKSQVLQRTADDIRKRAILEKKSSELEIRNDTKSCLEILQDGYIRIPKQTNYTHGLIVQTENNIDRAPMKSVQELVAKVENQTRISRSPEPSTPPRKSITPTETPTEVKTHIHQGPSILKMPQQPSRPAPILKDKPPKSKKFSLQNLIPFPTRKAFKETLPKNTGNNSESSDEEDNPIRSKAQPGPMKNANLLQTLSNYETMSMAQSPVPQSRPEESQSGVRPLIPKDAYFHDMPNRQRIPHQLPYREMIENGLPVPQYSQPTTHLDDYNQTGLPGQNVSKARNRNPLCHQTGLFDAMMQDHIIREMEKMPHCYGDLDQNTEIEIANQNEHFRESYYDNRPPGLPIYPDMRSDPRCSRKPMQADHNLLHSRLQSLAINTHLSDAQSQVDRESHNDSGYSTKVYGSSQGPSPSLSGHVESSDNMSGQRVNVMPNGKLSNVKQIGASSLV